MAQAQYEHEPSQAAYQERLVAFTDDYNQAFTHGAERFDLLVSHWRRDPHIAKDEIAQTLSGFSQAVTKVTEEVVPVATSIFHGAALDAHRALSVADQRLGAELSIKLLDMPIQDVPVHIYRFATRAEDKQMFAQSVDAALFSVARRAAKNLGAGAEIVQRIIDQASSKDAEQVMRAGLDGIAFVGLTKFVHDKPMEGNNVMTRLGRSISSKQARGGIERALAWTVWERAAEARKHHSEQYVDKLLEYVSYDTQEPVSDVIRERA